MNKLSVGLDALADIIRHQQRYCAAIYRMHKHRILFIDRINPLWLVIFASDDWKLLQSLFEARTTNVSKFDIA